jgi:hypothetical protein
VLNPEACPVPESLLGELYRASPEGLYALVKTIPMAARAHLAVYCSQRAHLNSLAFAIATTCDKSSLIIAAGQAGAVLYDRARAKPEVTAGRGKLRTVTLATGARLKLIDSD